MTNANNTDPLLSLVAEYNYFKTDSGDKLMAQSLLKNIRLIPLWTIEQTALACSVSVSTLRRFIKDMGYGSYTEFKLKIGDVIENYSYGSPLDMDISGNDHANYLVEITNRIKHDMDGFLNRVQAKTAQAIAKKLHDYPKIYIHDLLKSNMRLALQAHLAVSGKTVTISSDSASQHKDALMADRECLFLLVYDGHIRTKEVQKTIPAAAAKGAGLAVISSAPDFPGMDYCDAILTIGQGSFPLSDMLLHDLAYQYIAQVYKSTYLRA